MFSYLEALTVTHKFVRQYFSPKEFSETKTMTYLGENILTSGFQKNVTSVNNYNVIQNLASFYSNKFIDLSTFDFIKSQNREQNYYASKFDSHTQLIAK